MMLIRNLTYLLLILVISQNSLAHEKYQKLDFDYNQKNGLNVFFADIAKVKIGTDIECGWVRDGALYASFGLEAQIYRCSKFTLNFSVNVPNNDNYDGEWIFKTDFAPIYDSIKTENKEFLLYSKDTAGRDMDGNNHYRDWYKNLGSKIYYLGNIPIIEAYLSYKTPNQQIKAGRLKTFVSFKDDETFFGDDAKFSPIGYWLSKDLFSGLEYNYKFKALEMTAGLFSGGNPAKGYTRYLNGVDSPNLKSNNTPSYAAKLQLYFDSLIHDKINGYIFTSYLVNKIGSTWADELHDGKRNGAIFASGALVKVDLNEKNINSINLFGQWNYYDSGLKTTSSQNDQSKKFKDIRQKGFFFGGELKLLQNKLALGAAYEKFNRFDYNIFQYYNYTDNNPFKNSKQTSYILHSKYNINPIVSITLAYHKINNPALFVSHILDNRKTSKVKLSLNINM